MNEALLSPPTDRLPARHGCCRGPLRRATAARYARNVKRHHWLLLVAVLLFGAGWLLWNVVLVEQGVATPPAAAPPAR